ncbi:MAG: class I SAM-dependent methyltransferase, partial [bacterium]
WEDHETATSAETFDGEETYRRYCENIAPVADRIETRRMTSLEAAAEFADDSCDFVFIDASHEYREVRDDLAAWYPKVRSGGVLAGHDYHWPGVSRAVRDFATANGLKRPRKTELCWVMEKGRESRTRRQRLSDLLYWPWDAAYLLAGRLRYRHLVRRRRN